MKRDYIDGVKEDADFFVGKEVETTPTKGMQTLFVVGLQRTATVLKHAEKNKCKHIYFGANHSFKVLAGEEVEAIHNQLQYFLDKGYWVTFDTSPNLRFENIQKLLTNKKFTLVYGLRMDDVLKMQGNVVIKIDDKDFRATNPGVWCWSVRDMIDETHFTDWSQYKDDEII
jgi:ribulose bisphosphate carboxylase small subunit